MVEILKEKGEQNVVLYDLSRADMSQVIADSYRFDKLIVAAATYDGGMFPCMEDFLLHLKHKNFQNRKVGIIENSSWAPAAGKCMKSLFEEMKNISICENLVSIKSVAKAEDIKSMNDLADEILA